MPTIRRSFLCLILLFLFGCTKYISPEQRAEFAKQVKLARIATIQELNKGDLYIYKYEGFMLDDYSLVAVLVNKEITSIYLVKFTDDNTIIRTDKATKKDSVFLLGGTMGASGDNFDIRGTVFKRFKVECIKEGEYIELSDALQQYVLKADGHGPKPSDVTFRLEYQKTKIPYHYFQDKAGQTKASRRKKYFNAEDKTYVTINYDKNGKPHGVSLIYSGNFLDIKLIKKIFYKHGLKHGPTTEYVSEEFSVNGKHEIIQYYLESKKVTHEEYLKATETDTAL